MERKKKYNNFQLVCSKAVTGGRAQRFGPPPLEVFLNVKQTRYYKRGFSRYPGSEKLGLPPKLVSIHGLGMINIVVVRHFVKIRLLF